MTEPVRPSCSACVSTSCTFQHGGMSLYFWPVTTSVSRDYCAWDPIGGIATSYIPDINHTYVPTTTGPYAVVDGITMYQGNVYLSMMEPYVIDNCGKQITRQVSGPNVVTIASTDLYSVRKYPHNLLPWSVNYDDFNDPTPWSAYYGQRNCANNRPLCSVVFPHNYYPVMVMPPQVRNLDPNWNSCAFDMYGIFDPPVALHSVGNIFPTSAIVEPTSPATAEPVRTPPQPGQSGTGSVPVVTPPPTNQNPDPPSSSQAPPNTNPNPNPNPNTNPPNNNNDPPSANPNPNSSPNPGQNPAPTPTPNPTNPALNPPSNPQLPTITVGPTVIPVDPSGGLIINPGTTLTRGGAPLVISSTTFSIGDGGLTIISPSTSTNIPFSNNPVTVTLGPGNSPLTIDPAGSVILALGTTLRPGDPAITVSGSTLSIGPSGIVVIGPQGTSTIPIPTSGPQILTIGASTYTLANGALVLGPGTTLSFGDPAITISGTIYSIGTAGVVIVGPSGTSTIPVAISTQVITIGSNTYTMYNGELVLGPGTTIGVGDPAVTIGGTTFSVASTGVVVLSDGGGTTVPVTGTDTGVVRPTGTSNPTGAATGGGGNVKSEGRWMVAVAVAVALVALIA
ncbi:uncharacterized protein BDR25DRAFT_309060 [Lindgomyces ingoldianus]|uniref:Uncharacterized protein n=1 Tax=Lindgomyces ingoldianus TaxID=673940 RepID=A0ACB6RGM7_9PLEO|nr:uncharacterized protein BDR25DRAFT_309060 [Lindgomyces ingoldianus]KAF2478277.1 hypothetical protein BDR25DRAFT_309060 [Lindgomyces ingoldianus]